MTNTENVEQVTATEPTGEYRSIWSDLRGVSFSQGWLDVDGIRTRYLRAGDPNAPKLVLMPGTGGHVETYAANLGPLSEHFDCWAVDMIGQGYTDKPSYDYDSFAAADFLVKLFAAAGIERASLVGVSVGSWYAFRLAATHPELVDRLVLLAPSGAPNPDPEDDWYELYRMPLDQGDDDVSSGVKLREKAAQKPTWEDARQILTQLIHDPRNITDDLIAARVDVMSQPGAAESTPHVMWWRNTDRRIANTLTKKELAGIQAPVLMFVGKTDFLQPITREILKYLPNGRLIEFEGANHWIQYEAPHQFNELAIEFLTGEASPTPRA
ncbi:alpha/beta fold hydrolase [Streptomyces sp. SID5914]|nr:alpha/beta hydrolase [Streptomyces sp. SID5914]MZG14815.1 alpha/beta fold hydrolase [Streptomyces sp. SID5914]